MACDEQQRNWLPEYSIDNEEAQQIIHKSSKDDQDEGK